MNDSWDRIVDWLGRHAPPVAATINPPATEPAIARAEEAVRTPLPADLVAWWRRADGMRWTHPLSGGLLPPGFVPHSIERALEMPHSRGERSELPPGPAGSPYDVWSPAWLPIAADGCGAELFVDLREGPARGCVMEYDKVAAAGYEDPTDADVSRWPSVAAMLAEVADALEYGIPVGEDQIWVTDDGRISWENRAARWVSVDSSRVDFERLRGRYAAFVAEVRAGGFGAPPPGSWPAGWIAAHVVRNTELLIATTEAILATDPVGREERRAAAWAAGDMTALRESATAHIRYDNAAAVDPATLDSYAAGGLAALADRVARLGAHLCDLAEPLNRARSTAHVRVVDNGTTIVDGHRNWLAVLNALSERQLPLRITKLRDLR